MPRSLADYDSEHDRYERPEQAWVCGHAAGGHPCHIGPDGKGQCLVHLECVPTNLDGRWQCNRPKAAGGKCGDGPHPDGSCPHQRTPCQPRRSLLARRRVLVFFVAAAALGVLLLFSSGESSRAFLSPGQLSLHHQGSEGRCIDCHTASEGHAVLNSLGKENAMKQSFKCLDCHDFGRNPLHPHSVSPEQLALVTKRIRDNPHNPAQPGWVGIAGLGPGIPKDETGRMACAVCHQEHRGHDHDLKRIAEKRCHTCHEKKFHSFSHDHAEFTNYPYKRRTRIYFDHGTHYARHFGQHHRLMPDGKKPKSCTTCHQRDASGTKMLVRGFEQSCASCHEREIERDEVLPALTILKLPAIDRVAKAWPDAVVDWPNYVNTGALSEAAAIDQLPPVMLLLLSADPKFRKACTDLTGVNLTRLDKVLDPQKKAAIHEYLRAIGRLLTDWSNLGQPVPRERIQRILKHPKRPFDRRLTAVFAGPRSKGARLTEAVRKLWNETHGPTQRESKKREWKFVEWIVNRKTFSISYRPTRHADRMMQVWIEASSAEYSSGGWHGRPGDESTIAQLRALGAKRLFTQLSDVAAPGSCLTCHSVDRQLDGTLKVNWFSYRHEPFQRKFALFSHAPHLNERNIESCQDCHQLDRKVRLHRPEFRKWDWSPRFAHDAMSTSGFHAMKRADCAKCHTVKRAGESCLQCHNYHIGHVPPRRK